MKKFVSLLLLVSFALLGACGETDTNPAPTPPTPPPDTSVVTLTFSASSPVDYTLESVDASGVATLGNDPELTLTVGQRYKIVNKNLFQHPFAFSSSATYSTENVLLSDAGTGSLVGNAGVNYIKNSDGFSFTLTSELAGQLKSYLCTFHSGMFGLVKVN